MGETSVAIQNLYEAIKLAKKLTENQGLQQEKDKLLQGTAKAILNLAFVYVIIGYKEEAFDCITKELGDLLEKGDTRTYSIYSEFEGWLQSVWTYFNPSSRDLYIIALILYIKDLKEKALVVLDEAIGSDKSNNPYLWYQKGNIYLKQKDYSEALKCYIRAAEINPPIAEAHNNAAVVLAYEGNHDESRTQLAKAIKVNPILTVAHENLARLTVNESTKVKISGSSGVLQEKRNLSPLHLA